jgi:hypothetical protein
MIQRLRSTRLGRIGTTAGAVVLGIIALDLVASVITVAFGWELLKR